MSPNTCYTYTNRLEPGDGVFAGCSALERVTFCGPLKDFVWHDAEEPVLLRGFDREKTFLGCTRLRSMVAREVPLAAFPPQWRRYALNGFLEDVQRECHYAPAVMEETTWPWMRSVPGWLPGPWATRPFRCASICVPGAGWIGRASGSCSAGRRRQGSPAR